MKGYIFLSGGGDSSQIKEFDDAFKKLVTERSPAPICLYFPQALTKSDFTEAEKWFHQTYGDTFSEIISSNTRPETDVLYFGGGNTGRLLNYIYDSNLDEFIYQHLARGGFIYGGSAGAIVLGKSILTTEPVEHSKISNDGLDLLGGHSVIAHFDYEHDRRSAAKMSQDLAQPLLAIPEDAGVIVDGTGEMRAVGKSAVWIFSPDGTSSRV